MLSSIKLGSRGGLFPQRGYRVVDNTAIVGKSIAVILSIIATVITTNPFHLMASTLYVLALFLFTRNVLRKGRFKLFDPYAMDSWDIAAIEESKLSILSSSFTILANVIMIVTSFNLYMDR